MLGNVLRACIAPALLLVLLSPAACAEDEADYSFDVDAAFSPTERNEFLRAVDEWNGRTDERHQITIDAPSTWRVERRAPMLPTAGQALTSSRAVRIRPGSPTHAVALHELGHVLGLGHLCERETCTPGYALGVMDPVTVCTEFSAADMAECRRVGACR